MTKILTRSYSSLGYQEIEDSIGNLRQKGYVPWAILPDHRVVYATIVEARGTPPAGTGMRPYSKETSQLRRNLCHSKLGLFALDHNFSYDALATVSKGVFSFLKRQDASVKARFCDSYRGFLSGTNGYNSFGRLYDQEVNDTKIIWAEVIKSLQQPRTTSARVETLIAIHDAVGFQIVVANKDNPLYNQDPVYDTYLCWKKKMYVDGPGQLFNRGSNGHPGWYGRDLRAGYSFQNQIYPPATSIPGNLMENQPGFPKVQPRTRATDLYTRAEIEPRPVGVNIPAHTSGNVYYEQLDLRNELFSAGPSGTVCGALSAAFTFGKIIPASELFKEYLFAIIGYLVGGGMHSLHEVLTPLRMLGLEYNTGSLLKYDLGNSLTPDHPIELTKVATSDYPLLPKKFLKSKAFEHWRDEYYDIVVLGGIHWKF